MKITIRVALAAVVAVSVCCTCLQAQERAPFTFRGATPGTTTEKQLLAHPRWGQPVKRSFNGPSTLLEYKFDHWTQVSVELIDGTLNKIDAAPPEGADPKDLAAALQLGELKATKSPAKASFFDGKEIPSPWKVFMSSAGLADVWVTETDGQSTVRLVRFWTLGPPGLSQLHELRYIPDGCNLVVGADLRSLRNNPVVGPLLKESVDRIPEADARLFREAFGFSDLSQAVDLVVVGLILDVAKASTPGYQPAGVLVVKTANRFDVARMGKSLEPSCERLESDGRVILRDRRDGSFVHAPHDRCVVAALKLTQSEFENLLKAGDLKSPAPASPRFGPFRSGDLWLVVERGSFEQQIRQAGAAPGVAPVLKETLDQLLAVKHVYARASLVDDRVVLTLGAWSVNEANARLLGDVLTRVSTTQIGSASVKSLLLEKSKQDLSPQQHAIVKDLVENLRIYSWATMTVATSRFPLDPAVSWLRQQLPRPTP